MALKDTLFNWLQREVIARTDDKRILVEAAMRRGTDSPSKMLEFEAKTIAAQTIKSWKDAMALATDPDEPNRSALEQLYENLLLDSHLSSVIETRILFAQGSAFKFIGENDKENDEISWLFERPWFGDLIAKVIMSKFKGTTVVEFFDLTTEGELANITEIPQAHINSKLGLILKKPGDTTGWNYREGPYANQYLQIGRDDELGMLSQLALIVLAKKLGFGSLQDYVDKYGVPPLFITTDREDDTRMRELFNMASNFKSNNFMVGKGNEKFEFPNVGGQGTTPHEKLIELCNQEISKRILGGSGLTDEKSFVGAAEIQFRLAKDRFESDKKFFKYIFNTHVKPILINLSPVYAPLANHYFEWDNTESLNQKEIIDTIQKFGSLYDIDPEYITKITGIPILGIKQQVAINPDPNGGGEGKK